ncbi:MAG: hypothetical protein ABSA10_08560 [Anaerolineales bacterium]
MRIETAISLRSEPVSSPGWGGPGIQASLPPLPPLPPLREGRREGKREGQAFSPTRPVE